MIFLKELCFKNCKHFLIFDKPTTIRGIINKKFRTTWRASNEKFEKMVYGGMFVVHLHFPFRIVVRHDVYAQCKQRLVCFLSILLSLWIMSVGSRLTPAFQIADKHTAPSFPLLDHSVRIYPIPLAPFRNSHYPALPFCPVDSVHCRLRALANRATYSPFQMQAVYGEIIALQRSHIE